MMTHADEAVGEVIQSLKDKGIYDNTIIVFTSDVSHLLTRGLAWVLPVPKTDPTKVASVPFTTEDTAEPGTKSCLWL